MNELNNEINQLLNLAIEDLETAKILVDLNRHRPSISRAYYSMYYASQALLLSIGVETSTHKGVIKLLNSHFTNTGKISKDIAKLLKLTYDLRQSGDYNTDFIADSDTAKTAITNAQKFIDEVQRIMNLN
jgi:uncharacterized protein (UPF0332 family)